MFDEDQDLAFRLSSGLKLINLIISGQGETGKALLVKTIVKVHMKQSSVQIQIQTGMN